MLPWNIALNKLSRGDAMTLDMSWKYSHLANRIDRRTDYRIALCPYRRAGHINWFLIKIDRDGCFGKTLNFNDKWLLVSYVMLKCRLTNNSQIETFQKQGHQVYTLTTLW